MSADTRDSLSEFQSSIFDASDGHQLVDFIRKKKGLRAQPQKIFDDVPTNRQSLHIEIQRLDEPQISPQKSKNIVPQTADENENQEPNQENTTHGVPEATNGRVSFKSPKQPTTLFKRLSQRIGRRTLLKEFEKTLQESRFLPPTCSTPLTVDQTTNRTNTMKDKTENVNPGNLNIVCTPITITDGESENRDPQSKANSELAQDLEQQVGFVLERESCKNLLVDEACENDGEDFGENQHSIPLTNKTSTPLKRNNRQTYTIERDNISGNLILSPSKSTGNRSRHSILLKTPERSTRSNINKKLIVTPKQRQLLLSKFGCPAQSTSSPQKGPSPVRSRIPVPIQGSTNHHYAVPEINPYIESANLSQQHPETVKIIEEIQKKNTSNVPVIVIPVNQTFNQAPNHELASSRASNQVPNPEPVNSRRSSQVPNTEAPTRSSQMLHSDPVGRESYRQIPSPEPATSRKSSHVPNPDPVTSRISIRSPNRDVNPLTTFIRGSPRPPIQASTARRGHQSPESSSSASNSPIKVNSLRLKDILTDDESSDYHPFFTHGRKPVPRKCKRTLNKLRRTSPRKSIRPENKLSLTARPTHITSKVREVIKPQELSRMSEGEILDLRKRNSRGELRQSLKLTQRESSLLAKQMELELLRRSIQANNCEEEMLQMEIVAPPPNEFCDISVQQFPREQSVAESEQFVDEMSGDRISLNRRDRLSQSQVTQKPGRKKKKVSESVERYLETSKKIKKSKLMNLSKRKLYSKGDSEECSSSDLPLLHKSSTNNQSIKTKPGFRKSTEISSSSPHAPISSPPSHSPHHQSRRSPPPQRSSTSLQNKSNDSVNRSAKSVEFLPQSNEVSEKPVKTKRKYNKKPKVQVHPVDPDGGTSFVPVNNQACRRSKRERKQPTAYWSSTQTEFRPLFDYNVVVDKIHFYKKKTSTTAKNLVENTKEVKSKRVGASKDNKSKQKKTKNSKSKDDVDMDKHHSNEDLPQMKSKKSKKSKEKDHEYALECNTEAEIIDDPCPNVTQVPTIGLEDEPQTSSNKETSKAPNYQREPVVKINPLSRSILSASIQASSGYSSDVSSVQQVRLETIVEDTLPHVHQTNINSTMSSVNNNRLSSELMPPPSSVDFLRTKKLSSKAKIGRKSAFRTEHDKSIADVSPDHLNKLFDELKNSSVYVASDVTPNENLQNRSGQVSANSSRTGSHTALQRKCRKFAIRLPRLKVNEKFAHTSDKVCDSGFSSEDMSSVPKQKGDVLLNWLKQLVVNSKSTSGSNKGVARFLQADGFRTSPVEDLIFQEVDGVEYAFYDTKQAFSIGYMRFNPKTGKKKCTAKKYELNFVILSGKVNITVNTTTFDCGNGDLITVFIGTSYIIQNNTNDPALVMVIKK